MPVTMTQRITRKPFPGPTSLTELEQSIGGRFPKDYTEFLASNNGGQPASGTFRFEEHGRPTEAEVSWFFGVAPGSEYDLECNYENYRGVIPPGFCAIAEDAGGNLLLLCLLDEDHGSVWFWDHETMSTERSFQNMSRVADSFGRFLDALM